MAAEIRYVTTTPEATPADANNALRHCIFEPGAYLVADRYSGSRRGFERTFTVALAPGEAPQEHGDRWPLRLWTVHAELREREDDDPSMRARAVTVLNEVDALMIFGPAGALVPAVLDSIGSLSARQVLALGALPPPRPYAYPLFNPFHVADVIGDARHAPRRQQRGRAGDLAMKELGRRMSERSKRIKVESEALFDATARLAWCLAGLIGRSATNTHAGLTGPVLDLLKIHPSATALNQERRP